jgi:hypothetical protein
MVMMAYLLFAGDDYYPNGGAEDLQGQFETLEDAINAHDHNKYRHYGGWANILNLDPLGIVMYFNRGKWSETGIFD